MRITGKAWILGTALLLALTATPLAAGEQAFIWTGKHWPGLSYDAKVGYVKGIGNLADFEVGALKATGRMACIAQAFFEELKSKTVAQIIDEVDKFYQANPDKLQTPVIEVILRRCTKACPPETKPGEKKL
jgi:hypothetical protein